MTASTATANAAGSAIVRGGSGNVPHSPDSYNRSRSSVIRVTFVNLAVAAVALLAATNASATTTVDVGKCLTLTNTSARIYGNLTRDLGLSRQQIHDVWWRSGDFFRQTGFKGWGGLGLTPDQISALNERLAVLAKTLRPLGWPCKPFSHRAKTIAWVKAELVANGFRSAATRVTSAMPRQIQLRGIQDGVDVWIVVARSGDREVAIALSSTHSGGGTYRYAVAFDP